MSILMIQAVDAADMGAVEPLQLENLESLYQQCVEAATRSLSALVGVDVPVGLASLGVIPFTDISEALRNDQRYQKGVHAKITGDLRGDFYLFFSRNSAQKMIQIGFKNKGLGSLFLNRLEESFLNEFVNILINAFWQVFNERIPVRWGLTPPKTLNHPANSLNLANRIYARDSIAVMADLILGLPRIPAVLCFLPTGDSLERFIKYL